MSELGPVGNIASRYRLISTVTADLCQLALSEFDYHFMAPRAKMQQHFIS